MCTEGVIVAALSYKIVALCKIMNTFQQLFWDQATVNASLEVLYNKPKLLSWICLRQDLLFLPIF